MALVTAQMAADHLRTDTADPMVPVYVSAASELVIEYLKGEIWLLDPDGLPIVPEPDVPWRVQAATLLLIGHLYKNREPASDDPVPAEFGYGYLPQSVVALLYPMRMPSLA